MEMESVALGTPLTFARSSPQETMDSNIKALMAPVSASWRRRISEPSVLLMGFFILLHLIQLIRILPLLNRIPVYLSLGCVSLIPIALSLRNISRWSRFSMVDIAWGVYLLVSLGSVVLFLQPSNPSHPESFAYGLYYFVLPMTVYSATKDLKGRQMQRLLDLVLRLNLFMAAFSLVLLWLRPAMYTDYLENMVLSGYTEYDIEAFYTRLQGYLGSTGTGITVACTIVLLGMSRRGPLFLTIGIVLCLIVAVLTYQRGTMAGSLLAVVFTVGARSRSLVGVFVILGVAALFYFIGVFVIDEVGRFSAEDYYDRLFLEGRYMLEGRGYGRGWRYITAFPFGVGLGGASSAADAAGLLSWGQVVDANFMRILVELGLPGLFAYLFVIGAAGISAIRSKTGWGWICILLIYSGIMMGTNTLDSYYVSHCFWLYLAVINGESKPPAQDVNGRHALALGHK